MDFKKAVKEAMEPLAQDISALCRINSVEGEPKPGMPFGEGPAEALAKALELGESMGFRTENFDNYVGHIEFGEGEEMLGILGHVDVVPAGEGWDFDPWGGEIADGKIFGRGTLDDKGPIVTCLYAMKILKDAGVPLNKRIRVILGTNEETDWKCMQYYLNEVKPELPTAAFSPDAEFPLTYAEMGLLQYTLTRPISDEVKIEQYYLNEVKPELPTAAFSPDAEFPLTYAEMGLLQYTLTRPISDEVKIEGGGAFNSVPSSASVILPAALSEAVEKAVSESNDPTAFSCEVKEDGLHLTAKGVGAHAAHLQEGKNAISLLMGVLGQIEIEGELKEVVDFYNTNFGTALFGEKLGISEEDEDGGKLTLNIGRIYVGDGKLTICCDSRIPANFGTALFGEKLGISEEDEDGGKLTLNIGRIYVGDGKLTICCDSRIPVRTKVIDVENKLKDIFAGSGYDFEVASKEDSLYVPKDSPLVTTLMEAYRKVTGDTESLPMYSGGATYSRTMNNCVAFGCLLPDQIDTMHQANECLELKHLEIWLEIMVEAIYRLAK